MDRKSQTFFPIFFLAIVISIGFTYYHDVIRQDYVVFSDPDTLPDSADFFAYLVEAIKPYFIKNI
jgi:hypothetical protein